MEVLLNRKDFTRFTRKAWAAYEAHGHEYIEVMLGRQTAGGNLSVYAIVPLRHSADARSCYVEDDELDDAEELAGDMGLEVLGLIHTHPTFSACAHPSEIDVLGDIERGYKVGGIVHVFVKRNLCHTTWQFHSPWEPVRLTVKSTRPAHVEEGGGMPAKRKRKKKGY